MSFLSPTVKCLAILGTLVLLSAPDFAEARAGGGRSMGSRGSRTYQSMPHAAPIERSKTAPTAPSNPSRATNEAPSAAPTPPPANTRPFLTGLAGGLLGAGLGSMLFGSLGHAGMGGIGGAGSAFGGILQIALIVGGGYLLYRFFIRSRSQTSSTPTPFPSPFAFQAHDAAPNFSSDLRESLTLTDQDKQEFSDRLMHVQRAWSDGDMAELRLHTTPEMAQYFSQELSVNASKGLSNKVEHVTLLKAEILDSFREDTLEYASARLLWSACDYMVKLGRDPEDDDYLVSGETAKPEHAEEIWTFVRASGGHWLLSAIQQMQ